MILKNIWRGVVSNDLMNISPSNIRLNILLAESLAAFGRCARALMD